jgi:alpha-beta hydrolase superfamily lysophospholipase
VGRRVEEYVDPTRAVAPGEGSTVAAADERRLPVVVLHPAAGEPGEPGSILDGADPADGRFPIVVYAHGVSSNGTERNDALARWAAAGYVVVAPTFPLSSSGFDVSDLPNQPRDVEFVVEQFRAAVAEVDHELHGRVRSDCLALAGHSLGAATVLAAAFDPCCGTTGARAVVDIGGLVIPLTEGADLGAADPLPTLIVHGVRDATVPHDQAGRTADTVAATGAPVWTVSITEGQHSSMFEPPEVDLLTATVVAFLDAQLKGAPSALDALGRTVGAGSIATLEVRPGAD